MGDVKDTLLDFAETVTDYFNLSEDDFEKIEELIQENTLLTPDTTKHDVINFFHTEILCPHCHSFLGKKCSCFSLERQ